MPSFPTRYPPLPPAITQDEVLAATTADPDDAVKAILLSITTKLLDVHDQTNLLGRMSTNKYTASLYTLYQRLSTGKPSPSPIPQLLGTDSSDDFDDIAEIGKSQESIPPIHLHLGAFEDLYYALLSTLKAAHATLTLRLDNGFLAPSAKLYQGSSHTAFSFHTWLAAQWRITNAPGLVAALDNAIRRRLVDVYLCGAITARMEKGEMDVGEAEELRERLYDCETYERMPGLSWIGAEGAGMIMGRLNERYRRVFEAEKKSEAKKGRWARKMGLERIERVKMLAYADAAKIDVAENQKARYNPHPQHSNIENDVAHYTHQDTFPTLELLHSSQRMDPQHHETEYLSPLAYNPNHEYFDSHQYQYQHYPSGPVLDVNTHTSSSHYSYQNQYLSPTDQEHNHARAHRVSQYTLWLRGEASEEAWQMMGSRE